MLAQIYTAYYTCHQLAPVQIFLKYSSTVTVHMASRFFFFNQNNLSNFSGIFHTRFVGETTIVMETMP